VQWVARRAVEPARRIAADSPAQLQAVLAQNYLAAVHMHRGELRTAMAIAEAAFGLAERPGDRLSLGNAFQAGRARWVISPGAPAPRKRSRALLDLVAELESETHIGVIGLASIELRLGNILGRKVDLLAEPVGKERLRTNIERDRHRVF
jgi:hypothetical protein